DGGPVVGVGAALTLASAGVGRGTAGVRLVAVVLVRAAGPLPDFANHVVQAVAVGRLPAHRCGAGVPVQLQVLDRELALPGVGHPPTGPSRLAPGAEGPPAGSRASRAR